MPSEMRLWQIRDDQPVHVPQDSLDLESRLEGWLRDDIGMVNDGLLVIGQQVETEYGGIIDLLAIDSSGDLVILELKRDRTPRDIVAQALDYASWVQRMDYEDVLDCASNFFKQIGDDKTLEQVFRDKFGEDLPDIINADHRIYIVASSLDSATERIVEYLSETHGVDINAATFAYFKVGDDELIGRSMLLDEEIVQTRAETRSPSRRRRRNATEEELREVACENGVAALWDHALSVLPPLFQNRNARFSQTTMTWYGEAAVSKNAAIIGIVPGQSSAETGLTLRFSYKRISEHFCVPEIDVRRVNGDDSPTSETVDPPYDSHFDDHFFNSERIDSLVALLSSDS